MNEYVMYVKQEKGTVLLLFISAMAYSMAGYFFLPFVWTALANGQLIRWYHYVFGIGGTLAGIIGFLITYFWCSTQTSFRQSVKMLGKILGIYLGAQILLGILTGGVSEFFYGVLKIELTAVKVLTDVLSGVLQVPVQILALCLIIQSLSSFVNSIDRQLFIKGLAGGYICYLISLLYSFLDSGIIGLLVKAVCQTVLFTALCIYLKVQHDVRGKSYEA